MIVCLLFSHFAASLEQQLDASLREKPLIITEPPPSTQIFATCSLTAQAGITPGMAQHQAQLLCSEARFLPANPPRYQETLNQVLAVLADFSERVELSQVQQALVGWVDLGRLARVDVVKTIQHLGQAVREAIGLNPALGSAIGKFPAYIAAEMTPPSKALLVSPGQEASFLAPFSIESLPLEAEIRQRLKLLGLRTLGQLAALPAGAIVAQFGQQGRVLHRLARGDDPRPVLPYQAQPVEKITHQFEEPVTDQAVVLASLQSLSETLVLRLQQQGRLSREIGLTLQLENKSTVTQGWVLRQPTASPGRLFQALSDLFGQLRVESGIVEITVNLKDLITATGKQLELFIPQIGQAERLHEVLPNLVARYGKACFYQVSLLNGVDWLPERRFQLWEIESL